LTLLGRALSGGETIVCDKDYAGRDFAAVVAELGGIVSGRRVRPSRRPRSSLPQSDNGSESVFSTCKDLLTLERHGARTLRNPLARIATRLLALAACISLNHRLGRPNRAIADYTA
jgi:hypothetical protein